MSAVRTGSCPAATGPRRFPGGTVLLAIEYVVHEIDTARGDAEAHDARRDGHGGAEVPSSRANSAGAATEPFFTHCFGRREPAVNDGAGAVRLPPARELRSGGSGTGDVVKASCLRRGDIDSGPPEPGPPDPTDPQQQWRESPSARRAAAGRHRA